MNKNMLGFTLAEVMIVVVIIGIVAIIVLPVFLQDMQERINSNREANVAQKITKAMEVMTVNGDYDSFTTTEDFVNALKKYLKIIKICDNEHLTECWRASVVTGDDGNKYNVSDVKIGRHLHTNNDTNVVGLVLGDGATLLLTYNPKFNPPSTESSFIPAKKNLPIGNNKKKEFAYTSNVTGGIDYVVDLNGGAGPNAESDESGRYYDIRSFKIASFSSAGCPGYKVNGVCVYELGTNYPSIDCTGTKYAEYCDYDGFSFDYAAGAKKACAEIGLKLPDYNTLKVLFNSKNSNLPTEGTFTTSTKAVCGSSGGKNSGHYTVTVNNDTVSDSGCWGNVNTNKYNAICIGN